MAIPIIDHSNASQFMTHNPDGQVRGKGLLVRNFQQNPQGSLAPAPPFPRDQLTPRSDWSAIIKDRAARKSNLSDMWKRAGVKVLDQKQTNYCWAHGPVSAIYATRAFNNQPFQELSATAVAATVKQYRNIGGLGIEAIDFISANGVPTVDLWPPNAIDRRYQTPEMKAEAATRKITEWWDLTPRSLDEIVTCLFNNCAVAVGYNWWSHEVCAMDVVEVEANSYGLLIVNSWGISFGEQGFGILRGDHAPADDAQAVRVVDPTHPAGVELANAV